jgi:hypothetical protein
MSLLLLNDLPVTWDWLSPFGVRIICVNVQLATGPEDGRSQTAVGSPIRWVQKKRGHPCGQPLLVRRTDRLVHVAHTAAAVTTAGSRLLRLRDIGNHGFGRQHKGDFGYTKLDLGGSYQFLTWLAAYAQLDNFTSIRIAPVGYPSLPFTFRLSLPVALARQ